MRYLIILPVFLATAARIPASDAPPVGAPYQQVVYENIDTHATITLTGPDKLVYEGNGRKLACKYTIKDNKMHIVADAPGDPGHPAGILDLDMPEYGLLVNTVHRVFFATKDASEKAKNLQVAWLCLANAKEIVLACRLYASDNDGKFPAKLSDLPPTYLTDDKIFVSPLSAKKEAMGYDYLGAGATDSDDAGKIILRSKDLTADGKRIIVHADGSGEIKADK